MTVTPDKAVELARALAPRLADASNEASAIAAMAIAPMRPRAADQASVLLAEVLLEHVEDLIETVSTWRASFPKPQEYNCMTCGACCVALDGAVVSADVTSADRERLTAEELAFVIPSANGRWGTAIKPMAEFPGKSVCVFYEGTIGNGRCSIYERRPDECRNLENGRCACRTHRGRFALPVIGECDC